MSRNDKPLPQIYIGDSQQRLPASDAREDLHRQQLIDQAGKVNATLQRSEESKGQQKADEVIENVSGAVTKFKTTFDSVNAFYTANQPAFASAAASLANLNGDSKLVEVTMSAFTEYCPIVLKGLDSLGTLHPFIGVATKAFALVITMDLKRRENNRKVIALKILMQDTMLVLFELRHMKDPDQKDHEGKTVGNRMGDLLKKIAEDITEAGSACDHYLKKSFIAKTLKSFKYDGRLSGYGDRFAEHRKNLKFALSVHTALGVDSANTKLDVVLSQNESIRGTLASILQKLDTPKEKKAQEFVKRHGAETCIQNDQLLKDLITMSGEPMTSITSKATVRDETKNLAIVKKYLLHDFAEDLNKAFDKNFAVFERKMAMQNKQLQTFFEESLHTEGEHIISALKAGAHDRIDDPDMQALWKENDWKGSVKARLFVLNLQDYYSDRMDALGPESLNIELDATTPLSPVPPSPGSSVSSMDATAASRLSKDDRWALKYINILHVQPILEAIDDDGTGFISIKEVNTFASTKPRHWSLPLWIAYWAAGWHTNISYYQQKIYAVIGELWKATFHDPRAEQLPSDQPLRANRRYINYYLDSVVFSQVDLLLRSLRSTESSILNDARLLEIISAYRVSEEEMLRDNLEAVLYDIDTPATVALVTGPGRIERFILPLIYLLFKRHLKVLHLANKHILDPDEFWGMIGSLQNVFIALNERVASLSAIFKQTSPDVANRFGNFAFGLLQLSFTEPEPIRSKNSLCSTWVELTESGETEGETAETIAQIPLSILKYGVHDTLKSDIYIKSITSFNTEDTDPQPPRHILSGYWAGHLWVQDREGLYSEHGIYQICITSVGEEGAITGVAEAYNIHGDMEVTGKLTPDNGIRLVFGTKDGDQTIICEGRYRPESGVLTGSFQRGDSTEEDNTTSTDGAIPISENQTDDVPEETPEIYTFYFNRTPAYAWRFRSNAFDQEDRSPRALWAFARDTILEHVRRKGVLRLSSSLQSYLKARGDDRRRFLQLSLRRLAGVLDFSPYEPLSDEEMKERRLLMSRIHTPDLRFYGTLLWPMFDSYYTQHGQCICDNCRRQIAQSRFICLVCIFDQLSNTFDICGECRDNSTTTDHFAHTPSHPMLRVHRVTLDGKLAWAIPEAQTIANRVKAVFRAKLSRVCADRQRTDTDDSEVQDGSTEKTELETLCCCCKKEVNTPCWTCLNCSPDAYICDDCEQSRAPVAPDGPAMLHEHSDDLIRIHDAVDVVAEMPTGDATARTMLTLENKLAAVETRLRTFEDAVGSRIDTSLEKKFEAFEAKVEERFGGLERMFRDILVKLGDGQALV